MNLFDLLTLVGVMFVLVLIQTPVFLATLYGVHRFLEPTEYGDFNFETLTQDSLQKLLVSFLLPLTIVSTLVLSFLGVVFFQFSRNATFTIGLILVGLQFGLFYAGLAYWMRLEVKKSALIAGVNAFVYIFLYAFILSWAVR